MKFKLFSNLKHLKVLVFILRLLCLALLIYLLFLPIFPEIKYSLRPKPETSDAYQSLEQVTEQVENIVRALPESEFTVSPDRLIIPKIGVNAPITLTDNEDYGLSLGAWLVPRGSTPDKGGNTVITGHRFKYLPPNNLTFYLFHKLAVGDIFSVLWQGKTYYYQISKIKIVDPSDASPYDKSSKPILTMYTCHPIYSTEKRLVVISDLITDQADLPDVLDSDDWLEEFVQPEELEELEELD